MRLEIEPIQPLLGAVVHVERSALCDKAVVSRCLETLEDRGVLVFPRLGLTDSEQLAFTDALGTRVNFTRSASDVYEITLDPEANEAPEYVQGTFFWHIDGVTIDMPPPKATLLTARRISSKGGQTEFSNTYAAYEYLPQEEKDEIAGLRAIHSVAASMRPIVETASSEELGKWSRMPVYEHPIVWTHASGRKSLLIGTHADRVVGIPIPEGRALLTRLQQWASQPRFCYRHQWQEGDLVVWDNCGTMHRVIPYDAGSGRSMHRTSLAGVERVG